MEFSILIHVEAMGIASNSWTLYEEITAEGIMRIL